MQYRIFELNPDSPLLNVLLVRKDTGEPGDGAQEFLAERNPVELRLEEEGARTSYPDLWTEVVARAAEEVYRFPDWDVVYGQLFGDYVPDPYYAPPAKEDHRPPRGGGGEGANHRALRLWVIRHPERIGRRFRGASVSTAAGICTGAAAQKCTTGSVVACPRSPWEARARGDAPSVRLAAARAWEGPVGPRGQAGVILTVAGGGTDFA